MRIIVAVTSVWLVALSGAAGAQETAPVAAPPPTDATQSPVATQPPAVTQPPAPTPAAGPRTLDAPATADTTLTVRKPRTPDELVGKSVRDLSRGDVSAAVHDDVKALRRGPLLIHGNYCGIGNRPGTPPVDALDAACMRHDACTKTGSLPSCACDERLRREATDIAQSPATPAEMQVLASAVASSMAVLVCK